MGIERTIQLQNACFALNTLMQRMGHPANGTNFETGYHISETLQPVLGLKHLVQVSLLVLGKAETIG